MIDLSKIFRFVAIFYNREKVAGRQIAECHTDACVVNGATWGADFGFVETGRATVSIADKAALAAFFSDWLRSASPRPVR